jgi:hypothetical protein
MVKRKKDNELSSIVDRTPFGGQGLVRCFLRQHDKGGGNQPDFVVSLITPLGESR